MFFVKFAACIVVGCYARNECAVVRFFAALAYKFCEQGGANTGAQSVRGEVYCCFGCYVVGLTLFPLVYEGKSKEFVLFFGDDVWVCG